MAIYVDAISIIGSVVVDASSLSISTKGGKFSGIDIFAFNVVLNALFEIYSLIIILVVSISPP